MTYFVIAVYVFGVCVKRYVETTRDAADLAVQVSKYYADDDFISTIIFEYPVDI